MDFTALSVSFSKRRGAESILKYTHRFTRDDYSEFRIEDLDRRAGLQQARRGQ